MPKLKAIVTSGPTRERLDPVRYISNYSSGKQGHAIAAALAKKGFEVTLISGHVNLPEIVGVKVIHVESAVEMLEACEKSLPVNVAIFAAAVSDWRAEKISPHKLKKEDGEDIQQITLVKNPDILATISRHKKRPKLVIGFAAETENLVENSVKKLHSKGCDWILANDVGQGVFGKDDNQITLISKIGIEPWPKMSKKEVAEKLVATIMNK